MNKTTKRSKTSVRNKYFSDQLAKEKSLNTLLETIEKPALNALLKIETNGVKIDQNFLESYSMSDLLSELSEFQRIKKLKDNLETYIYLGEISHENHSFPLIFIPFDIEDNYEDKKRVLTIKFEKKFGKTIVLSGDDLRKVFN